MSQSSLEKQEAKLKALNQKIKDEKNKIEQRLGKQIISQAKRVSRMLCKKGNFARMNWRF
ncbi:hypothetical protein HCZ77_06940 [Limosilactobacillus fermentum]